jgi:hypothetical protein
MVYGIQGRVFSGTLEQLRQQYLVTGVARVRRVAPVLTDAGPSTAEHPAGARSTAPNADLRRAAALLPHTGLLSVPVADDRGEVLGFVWRSDLLRALATDPPLDLWR